MFERNPGPSRQPTQQQPTSETAPLLAPANSRSVQQAASPLNAPPPDLDPRDPATDPCCGVGHAAQVVATKFASALGIGEAAQAERQVRRAGDAAALARAATDPGHPQYELLSADMCWDAVKQCGVKAGAVRRDVDAQRGLVSGADALVPDSDAVERLPAGTAVGFFEGERAVHVMLSVGDGHACGNKNNCVGIGKAVGWESLDLKALDWDRNGGINAPGMLTPQRTLQVRARLLGKPAP